MSKRKPQRGACGVCGCPVVAPSVTEQWAAVREVTHGGGWDKPIGESGWASGHQYDDDGKLVKVRCPAHGGLGFAAVESKGDATVLM